MTKGEIFYFDSAFTSPPFYLASSPSSAGITDFCTTFVIPLNLGLLVSPSISNSAVTMSPKLALPVAHNSGSSSANCTLDSARPVVLFRSRISTLLNTLPSFDLKLSALTSITFFLYVIFLSFAPRRLGALFYLKLQIKCNFKLNILQIKCSVNSF